MQYRFRVGSNRSDLQQIIKQQIRPIICRQIRHKICTKSHGFCIGFFAPLHWCSLAKASLGLPLVSVHPLSNNKVSSCVSAAAVMYDYTASPEAECTAACQRPEKGCHKSTREWEYNFFYLFFLCPLELQIYKSLDLL